MAGGAPRYLLHTDYGILHAMRYLGIDYGERHIGVALSDEEGRFAFAHSVVENDEMAVGRVKELCAAEGVGTVVMGESLNYKREDNPVMRKIRVFAEALGGATGLPIIFHPEFLTTVEAYHYRKPGMEDASAAAIMLQSFLDTQHHNS